MNQEANLLSQAFRNEHWLFNKERFDRDLVADFLFLYSRAEYALKAAGFIQGYGADEPLMVDWWAFAEALSHDPKVDQDPVLEKAVLFLTSCPPRLQWCAAPGSLKWKARRKRSKETLTEFLVKAVCDVRNNLFHGGKNLSGRLEERDTKLIDAAIVVLEWTLRVREEVWTAFDDRPDLLPEVEPL